MYSVLFKRKPNSNLELYIRLDFDRHLVIKEGDEHLIYD